MSEELKAAATNSAMTQLYVVEDGTHNSLWKHAAGSFFGTINKFLNQQQEEEEERRSTLN